MLGKEIWAKNVGVAGLRRGFSTKYIGKYRIGLATQPKSLSCFFTITKDQNYRI